MGWWGGGTVGRWGGGVVEWWGVWGPAGVVVPDVHELLLFHKRHRQGPVGVADIDRDEHLVELEDVTFVCGGEIIVACEVWWRGRCREGGCAW